LIIFFYFPEKSQVNLNKKINQTEGFKAISIFRFKEDNKHLSSKNLKRFKFDYFKSCLLIIIFGKNFRNYKSSDSMVSVFNNFLFVALVCLLEALEVAG
jgi:hypothetical protein